MAKEHLECCTHVAESLYPLYITFQLHGMVSPPPSLSLVVLFVLSNHQVKS